MCRSSLRTLPAVLMLCVVGDALGQAAEGPAAADKGLVGWWKMDDAGGTAAADSSTHGRKGTLKDGLSFDSQSVAGQVGKALEFDGKQGLVEIAGYKGVTGTGPRAVVAWIKTSQRRGEIIRWGADDAGKIFRIGFIRGRVGVDPSGGYLYVKDDLADGKWHHVVAVVLKADPPNLHDSVKLYVDGAPAVIHDIGLLDLWPLDTGSDMNVTIGRGFLGAIDDVRLYDRALSVDEVKALFKLR